MRLGRLAEARRVVGSAGHAERDHADTRSAQASIDLADGDPRAAIDELAPALAGMAPIVRDVSVINALPSPKAS